jgi:hypothetical protein
LRRLLQQQPQQQPAQQAAAPPAPLSCDEFAVPDARVFARAGGVPTIPASHSPVAATAWTDADAGWMWSTPTGTVPSAWVYFYAVLHAPPGGAGALATLQYSADDAASATLNGVLLDTKAAPLWHWLPQRSRFSTLQLQLRPGRNVLMLGAKLWRRRRHHRERDGGRVRKRRRRAAGHERRAGGALGVEHARAAVPVLRGRGAAGAAGQPRGRVRVSGRGFPCAGLR